MEYMRLLRKERKKNPAPQNVYKDEYPEHLKHLYLAEKEKLKKEAWTNRVNRSKLRMKDKEEHPPEEDDGQMELNEEKPGASEETEPTLETKHTKPSEKEEQFSIPMSNRMRKKMLKKTSYQKHKRSLKGSKKVKEKTRGVP
ncbi:hypothetical protein WMY93_025777 [Mugilogobius chulae]|uniref:Uncharacterized protein n=1 Tax=Mugilogobius chulae TaxID=88201 RepID=A0AAW0MVM5_9GOBI